MMPHVPECTCVTCRRERRGTATTWAIIAVIYVLAVIMGLRAAAQIFA